MKLNYLFCLAGILTLQFNVLGVEGLKKSSTQKEDLDFFGKKNNVYGYPIYLFQEGFGLGYERFIIPSKLSVAANGIYVLKEKVYEIFPEVRYYFLFIPPKYFKKSLLGMKAYSFNFYGGAMGNYIKRPGDKNYEVQATIGATMNYDNGFSIGTYGSVGYGTVAVSQYGDEFEKPYVAKKLPFFYLWMGYRF